MTISIPYLLVLWKIVKLSEAYLNDRNKQNVYSLKNKSNYV